MSLEKEDLKSSLFKYEIAVFPLFSHHLFHNIGHPSLPENSEDISMFSGWGKKRGFFANHARCISVKKLHANSKYWTKFWRTKVPKIWFFAENFVRGNISF